jgi:hypothetical protein
LARFIYTDEAGTSALEPIRVVASVVVDGDTQLRTAIQALNSLILELVPTKLQEGFIFHAKEIFSGGKTINRDEWPKDSRINFMKRVLGLPRVYQLPIAFGSTFRGSLDKIPREVNDKITPAQYEHCSVFAYCIERADLFLRKYLKDTEIGIVIAEDVTKMRGMLVKSGMMFRDYPISAPIEMFRQSIIDKEIGNQQNYIKYEIKNIVDVPHFVEKGGAPLLQLADACAFAFRRCLSKQEYGNDLVLAMLGPREGSYFVNDPIWFEGSNSGLFNTEGYWDDDRRLEEQRRIAAFDIPREISTGTQY